MRTLADLPWQGVPVSVHLRVRRFFCEEVACQRAIFAERLPGVAAPYARRTERLEGWFTHVSFALGGEAGSRFFKDLGIMVSGDTLLPGREPERGASDSRKNRYGGRAVAESDKALAWRYAVAGHRFRSTRILMRLVWRLPNAWRTSLPT
jgi:transposase